MTLPNVTFDNYKNYHNTKIPTISFIFSIRLNKNNYSEYIESLYNKATYQITLVGLKLYIS